MLLPELSVCLRLPAAGEEDQVAMDAQEYLDPAHLVAHHIVIQVLGLLAPAEYMAFICINGTTP